MSKNNLFNIDIIAPKANDVKYLGSITKLNIFEFSGTSEFEPKGMFSTETFGSIGSTERNETMGYIDLGIPILHPKVYQNFQALGTLYNNIITGKTKAVFKDGDFVEDDNGNYGLYFFLKHYKDIKDLSDNNSDQRRAMIDLNNIYSTPEHMSRYVLVLPAGLRDYTVKDGKPSEDEINNLYRSLLSITTTLRNNNIDVNNDDIELYNPIIIALQEKFCDIYDYIKNILQGKTGYFQNQWAKHGVKYGTRNVITPSTKLLTNLTDSNKIRGTDTVIGIHQFAVGISPIAKREINILISQVFDSESNKAYLYNPETMKPELTTIKYKDVEKWTTFEGLEGLLNKFGQDDIKFMPIKISGKYLGLVRDTGNGIELFFNDEVEDMTNVRPLTYIEFIYIAIYDKRADYSGILTRFPVDSMTSSYFTNFYLKVTVDDRDVDFKYNGVSKKMVNYPLLNKSAYNSLAPHYMRLGGINGDYDGTGRYL